jgi:mono/diheme cytochrome c family protein
MPGRARVGLLWVVLAAAVLVVPAVEGQDPYLDNAPESARQQKNPYSGQRAAADAGKKLYESHCAKCHGANAKGGGNVPSLLSRPVQAASDGVLFWFISNGAPDDGMPAWESLPVKERWQLVTFVKSLGSSDKTETKTDPR